MILDKWMRNSNDKMAFISPLIFKFLNFLRHACGVDSAFISAELLFMKRISY